MHVDRVTFLWLTASIASSSCGPASPAKAPATDADESSAPIVDVTAGSHDQAALENANEPKGEPATSEGAYIAVGEPGASEHPLEPAPSQLVAQCRSLQPPPGPQCESFHSTPIECESYERILEPAAAQAATACLVSKSGTRVLCKFGITADCFLEGTRAARLDATARQPCSAVMRQCGSNRYRNPDLSMASCVAAVSAVRYRLRTTLIGCIAEGCGIGSCLYYAEPP